jgi:hypothetical protein
MNLFFWCLRSWGVVTVWINRNKKWHFDCWGQHAKFGRRVREWLLITTKIGWDWEKPVQPEGYLILIVSSGTDGWRKRMSSWMNLNLDKEILASSRRSQLQIGSTGQVQFWWTGGENVCTSHCFSLLFSPNLVGRILCQTRRPTDSKFQGYDHRQDEIWC